MDSSLARDRERFSLPQAFTGFARWLLWLGGRHRTGLAVQQQLDRDPLDLKRTKALLKPGIHDADRACARVCVSADTLSSRYEQRNTCRTH